MKYIAFYKANNCTTWCSKPYIFTNKHDAIAAIKEICKGEHIRKPHNVSICQVEDEQGNLLFEAKIFDMSRRFKTIQK